MKKKMKLKYDWGAGVVTIIAGMLIFMGVLVYIAVRQDYYLVEDNYYEKAVAYQQQIDKMENANALAQKIEFVQSAGSLELIFPPELSGSILEGTVHFYSPVNKTNDQKIKILPTADLRQDINTAAFNKGRYTIKVDWTAGGKSYYQEYNFNLK